MSDDLVKRLREYGHVGTVLEAADRIEELERQLKTVLDREAATYARHDAKMEAIEARLAKAVEALTAIAADASVPVRTWKNGINHKKMYKGWRKIATTRIDIARTTLAEITPIPKKVTPE